MQSNQNNYRMQSNQFSGCHVAWLILLEATEMKVKWKNSQKCNLCLFYIIYLLYHIWLIEWNDLGQCRQNKFIATGRKNQSERYIKSYVETKGIHYFLNQIV